MNVDYNHVGETAKHSLDVLSIGSLIAVFFDWLPGLTALLVLLWTALRIYETIQDIRIKRAKLQGAIMPNPQEDKA